VRSSKLLAALAAAGHRCHLFAFEPPPTPAGVADAGLTSVTIADERAQPAGPLLSTLALFGSTPRHFRLTYRPALFEQIRALAEARRADVVIAYELSAGDYVSRLDGRRFVKILDGCEPFMFRSPAPTFRANARVWKFKHFLGQMLDRYDAFIAVSPSELEWIHREVAPQHAWGSVVPNGTDLHQPYAGPIDRGRVIYTGSLTYPANLETVDRFLGEIWPAVLRARPDASFMISGEPPDPGTVDRLHNIPGVSVMGMLADYERFVSSSGALAVPLRRGGGTRVKILEAFALGCPVVASSKAVEGIAVTPGRDVLIADTAPAFAEALISVLSDEALRRSLIANGRSTAERHSWRAAQRVFVEAVERSVEQRAFLQPA
jgi:glycosyltransferase involved in cell wall biosynthesis